MKKLTKKAYQARMDAIAESMLKLGQVLAMLEAAGQYDSMNVIHDASWKLGEDTRSLEFEWNTRNWTSADWTSYSLVASNID